jgi:hypothetical protein
VRVEAESSRLAGAGLPGCGLSTDQRFSSACDGTDYSTPTAALADHSRPQCQRRIGTLLENKGRPPHGTGGCGGRTLVLLICLMLGVSKHLRAQPWDCAADQAGTDASGSDAQAGQSRLRIEVLAENSDPPAAGPERSYWAPGLLCERYSPQTCVEQDPVPTTGSSAVTRLLPGSRDGASRRPVSLAVPVGRYG